VILLVRDGREFLCEPGEELHTDLGVLTIPEDPVPGDVVESHLGEVFHVRSLRGPDLFDHMQRSGAPMMPRDIGLLIGETGVAASDRVLDAGTGTGVLAAYMARAGAAVVTYEHDEQAAEVARENMALAEVADRVEVRNQNVIAELDTLADEDPFDVLTLDTEDAPAVVSRAPDLLVPGGFLAVYSPFVEAARTVNVRAEDVGLRGVETIETIQRRMDVDDRGTRPTTRGVGHTGYLTFARA
jgi:tRNA (adenine57-N1/adenine58-N1)-methyltransferase